MTGGRRALVVSDSRIAGDPRVLRQIRWLRGAGWSVDTLGRGPQPDGSDRHFAMPKPSALTRGLAYLLLPPSLTYRHVIESTIPAGAADGGYDLVVFNEIELLPWFERVHARLLAAGGRAHLDLHEYAPSQRVGLVHRLIFKRYRDWMVRFVASPLIASRTTVANGIARLYADRFGIPLPSIVRSTPAFADQAPSPVEPGRIRLIHHGGVALQRGLGLLVDAMSHLDERFTLELMLVGSPDAIGDLRRQAAPLGDRVTFRDPVPVDEVATALNGYDAEIIFFPPVTENLRFVLPNKFFEAVQGRLALVIGPSVEMVELVEQYGNGVVADGWTAVELAAAIGSLDEDRVRELKAGSDRAAHDLSAEREGARFLAALEVPA
jgi:glycosyltransferase involved in cell wall biosynthesis